MNPSRNASSSYEKSGFAVLPGLLSQEAMEGWQQLSRKCFAPGGLIGDGYSISAYHKSKPQAFDLPRDVDPNSLGMYIVGNPADVFPETGELLACADLWDAAAFALDVAVEDVAFSFLNFTRKPALYGPKVSFHRDYGNKMTCTTRSRDMMRVIVPLCDICERSGGIACVPGSHRADDDTVLASLIDQDQSEVDSVAPKTKVRDVLIINSKVIHGGDFNRSPRDRINLVLQFTIAGADHRYCDTKEYYWGWGYSDFLCHIQ